MEDKLEAAKRWLTYKLISLSAWLHQGMFMHMCEAAVLAKYGEQIEEAKEALRDAIRLEQEHEYDYQEEGYEHEYHTVH